MTAAELINKLIALKKEHGNVDIAFGPNAVQAHSVYAEDFPFYGTHIVIDR